MDLYTALYIALVATAAFVIIKLIASHWTGICRFVGIVSIIALTVWFGYNYSDEIIEAAQDVPSQCEKGGKTIKSGVESVTKKADKLTKK